MTTIKVEVQKDLNLSNNYSKTKFYGEKKLEKLRIILLLELTFLEICFQKNMSFLIL